MEYVLVEFNKIPDIDQVISKADAISSTKKENNMKKKVIIIRSGSGKIKDAVDINLRPGHGIVS